MEYTVIFREVQRFRQWWLFLSLGGGSLVCGLLAGHKGFRAILEKQAQGQPLSEAPIWPLILVAVTLAASMILVFIAMKLVTEVRPDGLYIRFFPVHFKFKKVSLENVESQKAVTYHPIQEYGGWGVRRRKGKRAYNISGNRGVLITYKDGTTMLIGSQRPEELTTAIESVMS